MNGLKEFRKNEGLSQEKLARILGISLSMVVQVENGYAGVSAGFMQRLKTHYPEVNIDEMFFKQEGIE